jgi:cell division protein FtsZ
MMFSFQDEEVMPVRIKVVGVGGAGCNAVNTMIASGLGRVQYVAANTDVQALSRSQAPYKVQLGPNRTRGLGAGAKPEIGRESALESLDDIRESVEGAEMVFVTAGMGGGTGTGAAPVVAGVARELGSLTVGVVSKPFEYEGKRRMAHAAEGIQELRKHVDTLVVIPNQRLLGSVDKGTTLLEAFRVADDVLRQAIQGIADVITTTGHVNVDFADVRTVMAYTGRAVMGLGVARGSDRAKEAALKAISSPLLEDGSVEGARGVLLNITGGPSLSLHEVHEAASIIQDAADPQANIIVGQVINPDLGDEIMITVVATGFEQELPQEKKDPSAKPTAPARPAPPLTRVLHPTAGSPLVSAAAAESSGKDLERPTFLRRLSAKREGQERLGLVADSEGLLRFIQTHGD